MKKHLALGSALAVLTAATPALANYVGGDALHSDSFYASATGNLIWPQNQSISGTSNGSLHYRDSYGGELAGGFSSGPWRGELEGGYRDLRVKSATVGGAPTTNSIGKASLWTLMANGYYDVYTGTRFTPYIGAGIGWARAGLPASAGFGNIDSHDNRFAYQGLLGVSYTPETMPQTDWSLGYRYLGTTNLKYSTPTGGITESDLKTNSLELSFRYHF